MRACRQHHTHSSRTAITRASPRRISRSHSAPTGERGGFTTGFFPRWGFSAVDFSRIRQYRDLAYPFLATLLEGTYRSVFRCSRANAVLRRHSSHPIPADPAALDSRRRLFLGGTMRRQSIWSSAHRSCHRSCCCPFYLASQTPTFLAIAVARFRSLGPSSRAARP